MAGISSKAAGTIQNKEKTFQGQRFDDDLGLNWVQFKWRNHDPQIGRFIEIDPLTEDYEYNSTYAFSENKVTNHVELEGLEAVSAGSVQGWLGAIFSEIATTYARAVDRFYSITPGTNSKASFPITSTTNAVLNIQSETTYGTNILGWIESAKSPTGNLNSVSIFKNETKTTVSLGVEAKVEAKAGSFSSTVNNDGSKTTEAKVSTTSRGIPGDISVSTSTNNSTNEKSVSVKGAIGPSNFQVFGEAAITTQNKQTTPSVSVGVQGEKQVGKTKIEQSVYVKKYF